MSERGVASGAVEDVAERVLGAWDVVLAVAEDRTDLADLAELGSWPERPVLATLMAQARSDDVAEPPAKRDRSAESASEIRAALHDARTRVATALKEVAADPALARRELPSNLGPLPLLTQINAMGHELALALLRAEGARTALPQPVADAGLAALVDVVGGLACRQGLTLSAGAWEPDGGLGWWFQSDTEGWTTRPGRPDRGVPGIEGTAALILGAPGGPTSLPAQLARGELRLHRISRLMGLAPLVEQVPGLPGGPLLRRAVSMVGLFGRIPGRR
ncbi:hypothetical protein [Streptacidiphilus monticola]|uniref:Uncharacterized protein n=1 Tax=Streptacidiphilus monticola TaxID=2161674 RepID=A0ABW1FWE6_9ACTN